MRESYSINHQGCRSNREANDLSSERRKNREEGYMDPNTMPIGMTRYAMRENLYAVATSGW